MKYRSRVRIECDRRRCHARSSSTLDDGLHYLLMSEMKSVENAQRQNRRAEDIRILGAVKYFHGAQTSNLPVV
jgi:hypothetical protein